MRRGSLFLVAGVVVAVALLLWFRPAQRPVAPAATRAEPTAAPGSSGAARSSERAPSPAVPHGAGSPRAPAVGPARALGPARVDEGPPGGSIEGAVLSAATGLGIEGAEVTFQKDDGAASVRTAGGGSFVFAPPAPGRYRVAAVAAEGYLPFAPAWGHSQLTVDLISGKRVRGVAVRLHPAAEYTVTVRDGSGAPVGAAEVRVLGAQSGELALLPLPEKTATNAAGEAKVRAPDGATIEARNEARGSGRATVDFVAQVSRRISIRLGGAGSSRRGALRIAGRATDEQGLPVASALVAVRDADGRGGLHAAGEVLTDGDGRFSLGGLDAGEHELDARAEGFAPLQVVIPAGKEDVGLAFKRGGRLSGRVTDALTGQPVPSFTVQVWRRPRPLRLDLHASRAFVDAAGEYELESLGPGEAAVVIAAPGYAPSDELPVAIGGAPSRADAALRLGSKVRGTVVDRQSKAPIAAAQISIEGRRGVGGGPALSSSTTSDDAGAFEIGGLAPGPLALFVAAADHHARIFSLVAPAAGESPEAVVALSRLGPGEDPSVELAGVGAVLSAEGESLLVQRVLPGSGAAEAGLLPGDRILTIEGRSVIELGFEGSMAAIRGPEGTSVLLTVRRANDPGGARAMMVPRRLVRG